MRSATLWIMTITENALNYKSISLGSNVNFLEKKELDTMSSLGIISSPNNKNSCFKRN